MKKYWEKILRNNLTRDPVRYSDDRLYRHEYRNDFYAPENLIVTIKITKRKQCSFGGPSNRCCGGALTLGKEKIKVHLFPPRSNGIHEIRWDEITGIDLWFLPIDNCTKKSL